MALHYWTPTSRRSTQSDAVRKTCVFMMAQVTGFVLAEMYPGREKEIGKVAFMNHEGTRAIAKGGRDTSARRVGRT